MAYRRTCVVVGTFSHAEMVAHIQDALINGRGVSIPAYRIKVYPSV